MARPKSDITTSIAQVFEDTPRPLSAMQVVLTLHQRKQINFAAPGEVALVCTAIKHMLRRGELCRVGSVAEGRPGRPAAIYQGATALQHHLDQQHGTQIPAPSLATRQTAAIEQLVLAWA